MFLNITQSESLPLLDEIVQHVTKASPQTRACYCVFSHVPICKYNPKLDAHGRQPNADAFWYLTATEI